MNGTNSNLEGIARAIREAETIAVCSHVNPDGDTLGCAAAMRDHATKVETGMDIFEIVGTGGDNAGSFNISTTSATSLHRAKRWLIHLLSTPCTAPGCGIKKTAIGV